MNSEPIVAVSTSATPPLYHGEQLTFALGPPRSALRDATIRGAVGTSENEGPNRRDDVALTEAADRRVSDIPRQDRHPAE